MKCLLNENRHNTSNLLKKSCLMYLQLFWFVGLFLIALDFSGVTEQNVSQNSSLSVPNSLSSLHLLVLHSILQNTKAFHFQNTR